MASRTHPKSALKEQMYGYTVNNEIEIYKNQRNKRLKECKKRSNT